MGAAPALQGKAPPAPPLTRPAATPVPIGFGDSRAGDIESPEAADTIHDEIARSRRHGRPLSLTILSPAPSGLNAAVERAAVAGDRAGRRRYVYGKLARAAG